MTVEERFYKLLIGVATASEYGFAEDVSDAVDDALRGLDPLVLSDLDQPLPIHQASWSHIAQWAEEQLTRLQTGGQP